MSRRTIRRPRGKHAARDAAEGWCCDWLKWAWGRRREPGIYVFAEPPNEYREGALFCIAMRAIEQQDLGAELGVTAVPLTLSASVAIDFCPGCGVKLSEFYADGHERLVEKEIVLEHNALRRR